MLRVGYLGWSVGQSCFSVTLGAGMWSWALPWPISISVSLWLHSHGGCQLRFMPIRNILPFRWLPSMLASPPPPPVRLLAWAGLSLRPVSIGGYKLGSWNHPPGSIPPCGGSIKGSRGGPMELTSPGMPLPPAQQCLCGPCHWLCPPIHQG